MRRNTALILHLPQNTDICLFLAKYGTVLGPLVKSEPGVDLNRKAGSFLVDLPESGFGHVLPFLADCQPCPAVSKHTVEIILIVTIPVKHTMKVIIQFGTHWN